MASHGIDPAFPPPGGGNKQGLTIRDYFASAALTGLLAATGKSDDRSGLAGMAYQIADEMLAERK